MSRAICPLTRGGRPLGEWTEPADGWQEASGWLLRRLIDRFLRPVYLREIANLEAVAAGRATS